MSDYLEHHGIDGQKWGFRNGPPYPLNAEGKASFRAQKKKEKEKLKRQRMAQKQKEIERKTKLSNAKVELARSKAEQAKARAEEKKHNLDTKYAERERKEDLKRREAEREAIKKDAEARIIDSQSKLTTALFSPLNSSLDLIKTGLGIARASKDIKLERTKQAGRVIGTATDVAKGLIPSKDRDASLQKSRDLTDQELAKASQQKYKYLAAESRQRSEKPSKKKPNLLSKITKKNKK